MAKRILNDYRRKYLKLKISDKRRKVKLQCIEYKGGKCEMCGYNACPAALIFHHKDPIQKDFAISSDGYNRSFAKCKPELDKCILVCANCHAEIHHAEDLKNRQRRIEELEQESKYGDSEVNPSIIKECDNCKKEIKVYFSYITRYNYCNRECRDNHLNNLGWPSNDVIKDMRTKMSVKEIALTLNKSLKSVYKRLSKI